MKLDQIKAVWNGYSTRKKWIIGGIVALVAVGAAEAGDQDGRGGGAQYAQGVGPQAADGGYAPGAMPAGGVSDGGGYASVAPAAGGSGSVDVMSGWEANSKRTEDAERGADLTIRGQTDLRDTQTGQIVPEVPDEVANPAIASGAATEAPAAEVSSATTE